MNTQQYNQELSSWIYGNGKSMPVQQYSLSEVNFIYPSKDHGDIYQDFDTLAFKFCEIWHHKHKAEEKLINLASIVYPIIEKISKKIRFPNEGFLLWKESVSTEKTLVTKSAFDFLKTPPTRDSFMVTASKIKLATDMINRVCSCNAVSLSGLDILYSAVCKYPDTLNIETCKCLSLKESCSLLISMLEDDIGNCPADLAYNSHALTNLCIETYRTQAFWDNFDNLAKNLHKLKTYGLLNDECGILNRIIVPV